MTDIVNEQSPVPHHIAIIPDGNRRWAKEHGLPTLIGHQKGLDRAIELGKKSRELGIKVFTIWGFSTENWDRSKQEVSYLMKLFETMIDKNLADALKQEIRIVHLGRKDRFSSILQGKIQNAEEKTKSFSRHYLGIALDYGGRDEILRAIKKIPADRLQDLTEKSFSYFLDTKDLPYPYPDMIIRTGGEYRLSGYLSWQSSYSELFFVKKALPDFTPADFELCINEFQERQRRYGK